MTQEMCKKAVGMAAAALVQDNMVIGLGTGSTAACFIQSLGSYLKKTKIRIQAVASSEASTLLAQQENIPLLSIEEVSALDLYFDGADEIDPEKNMIKGKGGALLKEKILASIAQEMVVMVDETKLVPYLGFKGYLPVEVVPFASLITKKHLFDEGYLGEYRKEADGRYIKTENGNLLFEVQLPKGYELEKSDHERILQIPGVIETGFFYGFAGRVIVGYTPDKVEILT